MKAARCYAEQRGCVLAEVVEPSPGPEEVVVAIRAAGVCGTDVHIALEHTLPIAHSPITLGHEGAGTIAALGTAVRDWSAGDRVAFYPAVFCGACGACQQGRLSLCPQAQVFGMHLDGTFAEYVRVPARCLLRLPDSVPFEAAAILTDALATAYHAVYRRGALRSGETVAVFGCGGVGYQAVVFARRAGAVRIIAVDTSAGALARAEQAGATDVVAAREKEPARAVRALTAGKGVDVAFEFVGKKATVEAALCSLGRPGRAVVVGVGPERVELPPLSVFVGKELALIGSMGSYREDVDEVLRLLADGELDPRASITHRYALAEVNTALETLAQKRDAPVRIVLTPGGAWPPASLEE